ncbi:hypothetical protein BDR06DRAFT_975715 [Suillus hirtellus]|nr:hypothetical protein BDR06DRAFT_975715 [Suillus hirtellus]
MHGVGKCDKEAEAITKEISRAVAKLYGHDDNESESDTDSDLSDDDTLSDLPACLHTVKTAKENMLILISANPCEFAKDKLAKYIKSIPDNCSAKGDISIIANSISKIETTYLEDIQLLEMFRGVVDLTIAQWLGELMYQKGIKI